MAEIIAKSAKKYGAGTIGSGMEVVADFPRIPTGIFALDTSIAGGIPIGVTSSVYGNPSGGKSTLVNRIISGAQNICWNCTNYLWDCKCSEKRPQKVVLVHLESMDRDYAEAMGVNMSELIVVEPKIGEEAVDIIMECIRSDDCGLVVLDSLAMLTSTDEMEGSAFDKSIGLQARLISSMMRKLKTNMVRERKAGHPVSFIATNQIRAKIGGYGNQTEDVPGGYAAKHDWHLTLRVSQLTSPHIDKETEMPMYARFKASNVAMTNKRKCYMLYGSAEYFITTSRNAEYSVGSIYDYKSTYTYLDKAGLIEKNPKWRCNLQPDLIFDTKDGMISFWEQNPQQFLSLKKVAVDYIVRRAKSGESIEF